ncbi:Putative ribonuclease H protein [Dendrobium catenatum]|uniref:Ribonuclease H protein n=1 Tax=Dendrobium catenatum TaxID=906689 RepID=A0A2I0WHI1_9ASPA|nr:Putative ribonuclease H protein [Dendrobium catenatum]
MISGKLSGYSHDTVILSIVYVSNSQDERISLWEEVRRINPSNNLPWIVAGDFNCCRFVTEKAGGNPLTADRMGHFNSMIFDTALTDLTFMGIFFTWNNQRSDNPISIKLDKALVNEKWIATFPSSYYKVLSASISDHSPLIIYPGEHIKKIHRFLFKNHWTRYKNFWEVLIDVNPELRNNLKIINSKLTFYNSIWTSWVKQRSKVKWLKNGEEDLKFLYSRIHRRKAASTSSFENALFGHSGDRNSKIHEIIDHFKVLLNHNNKASADVSNFPIGTCIPIHLTEALIKPVTLEEVKNVVFAGHSDSAPGPDGFNFDFYKKCWHIIGNDVFRAVQSFFVKNYLPVGVKATALVLIPKNKHACSIDDFRPIALCNVFYKIIAKILADRLKLVMPFIIHNSQAAFISDRLATDNTILADEIMKMFNNTRRDYFCAKFDIKKAFDTVSRDFLISRMTQKGFPREFTNWIKTCITNVNFSICLNGSLEGFFSSSTGLRQGCPLSPYLFCIVMDSLSCLIDEHANMRNFRGISVGDFKILHLLYADDLIVFGEANNTNCSILTYCLAYISACSGLYTNSQKSYVSFSQHTTNILDLACILNIPNITNKFNYLGIPISTGKIKASDFNPLLEKITFLLSGWKASSLSIAGRMQYIKYTISNTVAYWVRAIFVPNHIIKSINKACARFLYFGSQTGKSMHLISWDNTCKPYRNGGLSITSLEAMRYAYNCSTISRMYNVANPLSKYLLARYNSPWKSNTKQKTRFWKGICKSAERAKTFFLFSPHQSSKASIKWDHWCMGESLICKFPELSPLNFCKDGETIDNWIINDKWCIPDSLREEIRNFISKIPLGLNNDLSITWKGNIKHSYKDYYLNFFENQEVVDWSQLVWHKRHSPRYSIFTWMAILDKLKSAEALAWRGICIENPKCHFCQEKHESTRHLFFECDYSYNTLIRLIPALQNFLLRPNVSQALDFIGGLPGENRKRPLNLLLFNAILYHLWRERNNRRFKATAKCSITLAVEIAKEVRLKMSN